MQLLILAESPNIYHEKCKGGEMQICNSNSMMMRHVLLYNVWWVLNDMCKLCSLLSLSHTHSSHHIVQYYFVDLLWSELF